MAWINYNHLYYFWVVAREGSIARAAVKLKRSQPTLSAQLRLLEGEVGEKLFSRAGRGIQATDMGREIFRYADDIFRLGEDLGRMLEGRPRQRQEHLVVGAVGALPKPLVYELLSPALEGPQALRLTCREDRPERLFPSLALNELDLVLSDRPSEAGARQRLQSQLLGRLPVSFFAGPALRGLKRRFPRSLDGAPLLLPTAVSAIRSELELWLEARRLRPHVVAELEDAGLLAAFAQHGHGVFAAASALARQLSRDFGVVELGRAEGLAQRVYAVSHERSSGSWGVKKTISAGQSYLRMHGISRAQ